MNAKKDKDPQVSPEAATGAVFMALITKMVADTFGIAERVVVVMERTVTCIETLTDLAKRQADKPDPNG